MIKNKNLFLLGTFVAIIVAILDLASKRAIFTILENMATSDGAIPEIKVFSFFSLVYVWNMGVSFGMFSGVANSWIIFSAIQFTIVLILFFWLYNNDKKHYSWALGFIIGGAFGNLIDRLQHGGVADFLDFYIKSYHWPAFNVADSFVFIGVFILIFDEILFNKKTGAKNEK